MLDLISKPSLVLPWLQEHGKNFSGPVFFSIFLAMALLVEIALLVF